MTASAHRPALPSSQMSAVLESLGRAMGAAALPAAAVYVAEHGVTVLVSTEVAALRWRDYYPVDVVNGIPLTVFHVDPVTGKSEES